MHKLAFGSTIPHTSLNGFLETRLPLRIVCCLSAIVVLSIVENNGIQQVLRFGWAVLHLVAGSNLTFSSNLLVRIILGSCF